MEPNSTIFMIADTHFWHRNVIHYCTRPFQDVEEMNETLVRNWNSAVKQKQQVFMLGDFSLSSKADTIAIGQRLNGRKTLILGNHDQSSLKTYYEAGFEVVSRHPIIFRDYFILSHKPQNIMTTGTYGNIFGHIHDNPIYPTVTSRSFCVSAERINYTPISFEDIMTAMKKEEENER